MKLEPQEQRVNMFITFFFKVVLDAVRGLQDNYFTDKRVLSCPSCAKFLCVCFFQRDLCKIHDISKDLLIEILTVEGKRLMLVITR